MEERWKQKLACPGMEANLHLHVASISGNTFSQNNTPGICRRCLSPPGSPVATPARDLPSWHCDCASTLIQELRMKCTRVLPTLRHALSLESSQLSKFQRSLHRNMLLLLAVETCDKVRLWLLGLSTSSTACISSRTKVIMHIPTQMLCSGTLSKINCEHKSTCIYRPP